MGGRNCRLATFRNPAHLQPSTAAAAVQQQQQHARESSRTLGAEAEVGAAAVGQHGILGVDDQRGVMGKGVGHNKAAGGRRGATRWLELGGQRCSSMLRSALPLALPSIALACFFVPAHGPHTKRTTPAPQQGSLVVQHAGRLLHPQAQVARQARRRALAPRLAGLQNQAGHGHKVGACHHQADVGVDDAHLR